MDKQTMQAVVERLGYSTIPPYFTDGALLLAMLNAAAENSDIGNFFVGWDDDKKQWSAGYIRPFMSFHDHFEGPTPLEAVALAFAQLPMQQLPQQLPSGVK